MSITKKITCALLLALLTPHYTLGIDLKTPSQLLWNLANFALRNYFRSDSKKMESLGRYHEDNFIESEYKAPYYYGFPQYALKPQGQSLMDVLFSIARNDDLNCVPKLLCETTSGFSSGGSLPFNLDAQSFMGMLSAFSVIESNPILSLGKAAMLGFTSKGNVAFCKSSYPKCPEDPDELVYYLNNHNGGFFKYFNQRRIADPKTQNPNPSQALSLGKPWRNVLPREVEQRIQNKPIYSAEHNVAVESEGNRGSRGLTFPVADDSGGRSQGANFKFPVGEENETYGAYRKPKELPYGINFYATGYESDTVYPSRHQNFGVVVFPTRTGTGDLRLDPEEFRLQNDDQFAFEEGQRGYSGVRFI